MLIPAIENVEHIFGPLHPGTQISADNGYSTDENAEYLEHKQLDGYISTRKLSRILKKYNIKQNPYSKDNFTYNHEKDGYICPLGQIMNLKGTYKNKKNSHKTVYWTKKCHDCQVKEICATKNQYRTITDYGNPAKIRMQHKMDEKWAQEIYAQRSKNSRMAIRTPKTQHKNDRIQLYRHRNGEYRDETTCNRTQPQKTIQRTK